MDRGAWQATVHGIARVGLDLAISFFSFFTLILTHLISLQSKGLSESSVPEFDESINWNVMLGSASRGHCCKE